MNRCATSPQSSSASVEPIRWTNLLSWARRTAFADRKTYHKQRRGPSIQRVIRSVSPNLSQPIFLIGSPRSGTTFLGNCLASLPEISYHYEPIATKAATRYVYEHLWSQAQAEWFYRNVYAWLMRLHGDGDLRFAEKTPRNCFNISFLAQLFPDAKFIHIIRDGRDVALSLRKKPWFLEEQSNSGKFEPGGYPYGPFPQFWVEKDRQNEFESTSDIHRCIWVWKRFTESALAASKTLTPDQYLELRYESLGHDNTGCSAQILNFIGISSDSSKAQFRQSVDSFDVKLIGQWKRELTPQQLSTIQQEAGSLLSGLKYT